MGACTRFALVLLAVASIALAQQTPAPSGGDFEWRVQLKQNTVAPSTIEAINRCKKTHRFQVDPATLPFMRVLGPVVLEQCCPPSRRPHSSSTRRSSA